MQGRTLKGCLAHPASPSAARGTNASEGSTFAIGSGVTLPWSSVAESAFPTARSRDPAAETARSANSTAPRSRKPVRSIEWRVAPSTPDSRGRSATRCVRGRAGARRCARRRCRRRLHGSPPGPVELRDGGRLRASKGCRVRGRRVSSRGGGTKHARGTARCATRPRRVRVASLSASDARHSRPPPGASPAARGCHRFRFGGRGAGAGRDRRSDAAGTIRPDVHSASGVRQCG